MGSDPTSRTLVAIVSVGLIAWALWLVRDVLPPFLIAFALALLLDPVLDRMQRRRIPRPLAVAVTFALSMGAFAAAVLFVLPHAVGQVADLLRNLDRYGASIQVSVDRWLAENAELVRRLNLPPTAPELWREYQGQAAGALQILLQRAVASLQAAAGTLGWLLVVPIVTLYLLIDLDPLLSRLRHLIPAERREATVAIAGRVGHVFAAYLRGLTAVCAAFGVVVYLVLAVGFGLPYALILGLVAAVLYAIPYLGQLALLVLCCLVAWGTGRTGPHILGLALSLVAVGQLFDQLITPRVIGKQVGLHPALGLFALMVGGQLFGLGGMVLAVPVAASIRVVLIHLFPRLTEPIPEGE